MDKSSNVDERALELYDKACDLLTDPSAAGEIRTIIDQLRQLATIADADTAEDLRARADLLEQDLEKPAEARSDLVRQAQSLVDSLDTTSLTREEFETRQREVVEALNRLEPTTESERRSIAALGQSVILATYD